MIDAKLEEIRRRLLDLTRKNRLLNHRATGQGTLAIVDEVPGQVYRKLVDDGCAFQFLSREEAPEEIRDRLPRDGEAAELVSRPDPFNDAGQSAPDSPPLAPIGSNVATPSERHQDLNLQTALAGEKLQARLVHLAREANSALQEQGYNILYLTLGMVDWYEPGAQQTASRAPLIFVPVELKRKTVNTRHSLRAFDDEILTNQCLSELCQSRYQVTLPKFDPENDELNAYFDRVRESLAGLANWRVTPEVHLGLFSFSKLLMYRDLDPQSWPDAAQLTGHPLVSLLAGLASGPDANANGEGIPDPASLDATLKPMETFQVVDADSSQQAAILAAKRGMNLVIDGPPGTGKSQTITNIIAECMAAGRTVLFVSEKAAALEVVKRRLEEASLGDAVLELHSRKASKKAVLLELQRTLERESIARPVPTTAAAELERTREELNAYRRELHEPFGRLGISPFQGIARETSLAAEPEVACDVPDVSAWSPEDLTCAQQQLEKLDRRWQRVGDPSKHPWRGVGLSSCGVRERQRVRQACEGLSRSLANASTITGRLAALLNRPAGGRMRDSRDLLDTADRVLAAPVVPASDLQDGRWDSLSPELLNWLDAGRRRQELRGRWGAQFKPEAESEDWQAIAARRRTQAISILRLVRPSWYSDGKRLRAASLTGRLPAPDLQVQLLDALVESGRLRRQIETSATTFVPNFGSRWAGIDGDWAALTAYAQGANAARKLVSDGRIDPATAGTLIGNPDRSALITAANDLREALGALESAWREWLAAIGSDEQQWLNSPFLEADWGALRDRLALLPDRLDDLSDWIDFRNALLECANGRLKAYVDAALRPDNGHLAGRLAPAFTRHFYRLWVEGALAERPSLGNFRGPDHEALIARFRAVDTAWLEQSRRRLATDLAARRPVPTQPAHRQSKLGLLQAEFRKKSRHLPLRKLLHEAGDLIQAMKPCFMMSPLSIAQYLGPGAITFDVVVFDEASQVEEADAYGALARARQVILVGDERQLPPTDFFARSDPREDDSDESPAVRVGDLESVLSAGIVHIAHRCSLRWHYRSRHSSLIEFSNHKFYEDQLRVFPSPHTDCSEIGLAFQFVEGGTYLRGAGRYNPVEARAVAAAVLRHAVEHPDLSLGVGTLNLPQRMAIEDEVERLRREQADPRVEAFFAAHPESPFFVKNLENIQGDERDVIFLSVGFGKDANGRMSLNFGALNDEGGWRRLNVLITRARLRCVVFSSIRADDIALGGGTQARGVVALKEYLYAAEQGRIADAPVAGGGHDSEFEAAVCTALRDRGWEVHTQVGCAGFAIDMAVVNPLSPGRYLLGVECDGATYHSSPTARDRDRLRQAVLEGLGWKIHRIWSTDWFQRPAPALEALLRRLDQLKREFEAAPKEKEADRRAAPSRSVPADEKANGLADPGLAAEAHGNPSLAGSRSDHGHLPEGVTPYVHCRGDALLGTPEALLMLPPRQLSEQLRDLVVQEGPIHHDEAARAIAERFEARVSSRIRTKLDAAIEAASSRGWVARRGEFLWPAGMTEPPVRARGEGCPVTKPELIAPEEFEAAVKLVVRQQFGLKFDAVVEAAARTLGFARTAAKLREAIQSALVRLDERGEIQLDGSNYVTTRTTTRHGAA